MWIVEPDFDPDGAHTTCILHLDSVVHTAHLIGVYGEDFLPRDLSLSQSLNIFESYYVNKYIDHHSFEIAF